MADMSVACAGDTNTGNDDDDLLALMDSAAACQ